MHNYILFEDGKIVHSYNGYMWCGFFSKLVGNGTIIQYIQSCLPPNTVFLIPQCDGNINKDNKITGIDWNTDIQPHIDYAKSNNKIFMLGTLCQIYEEPDCNYVYIPLDDDFFKNGLKYYFNNDKLVSWDNRSSELCWRGSCSGYKNINNKSTRERFVETIYNYNPNTNVRLIKQWSEGKNIPQYYFDSYLDYTEFLKYKIFFIVDGNVIASNHMYSFATGCIPFLISNGLCWFSNLVIPYTHYIPINYDLSNLIEQIEWVKNNDEKAKIIAENAYKFSEIYFSSGYQHKFIRDSIEKYCLPSNSIKQTGFIILRHVNNEETNKYWIHCYDCIRKYYPEYLILIIDDNSKYEYITEKELYKTTIINSEYHQRGELLPYYYYLHNKLFDTAVIIHDTVFINTYIDFNVNKYKHIWSFDHCHSAIHINEIRNILNLFNDKELLTFFENKQLWEGCFGGMTIITHDYLRDINNIYDISKLLGCILNRFNRSSFERVIACLLQKNEKPESLLGDIHAYCKWGISFNEKDNYNHLPLIKVWS